jgi:eukaryotic-like serine/threonine-protein kinase
MPSDPRRVKELFGAALDLPDAAARRAFLDRECAVDPDLRKRLDVLLAAHDQPESALERPIAVAADPSTGAFEPRAEAPGTLIADRFKLLEPIGEGGMGEVWVADQLQPIRRRVALKVIKAGMDTKTVLARFEAERQALALMDHPNIAKVLDAGTTADGRPFFVMELVKGTPITQFCDARKLSPRERLELFVPVCQAIQHAHTKGIIHRDIKPSNVLVALHDERPVPKVIDFGVAKAVGQQLTEKTIYTGLGTLVGTPAYMAPEQATFNQLDVDTRADVYALGVLLYELLAGSPPFEPARLKKVALDEVLRLVREEEPPRPSARLSTSEARASIAAVRQTDPGKLSTLMRGELDWIVMKALEKERTRRYETASGFALDVQRYLAGEPVLAHPPSAGYRVRKFVRRNRASVLAGTLFAVLLAMAAVVSTWLAVWAIGAERSARESEGQAQADAHAARDARDAEAMAKADADARRGQAELSAELLASVFEGMDPQASERGGPDFRQEVATRLDKVARKVESEITEPVARSRTLEAIGLAYLGLGFPAKAVPLLEQNQAIRAERDGPYADATLTARNQLSYAYGATGRPADALRIAEGSLEAVRGQYGPDDRRVFDVLLPLASAYNMTGRSEAAVPHLKRLLSHLTTTRGADDPRTIVALNELALAHELSGRVREAIPLYIEVRDRYQRSVGPEHLSTLTAINNLAGAYRIDGRTVDAISQLEELVTIRKAQLGLFHPDTLTAMNNLALAYRDVRRLGDAIPMYEEVLKYRKLRLGDDNPDTLRVMCNLGVAYEEAWRLADADKILTEALARFRKKFPGHPDLGTYTNNLARVYSRTGRLPAAIRLYEEALELKRSRLPPDHPDVLHGLNNLGAAYWDAGQPASAIPLLEKALRGLERVYGPDHPQTLQTLANLAVNLFDVGRPTVGLPLMEDAYRRARARPGPAAVQVAGFRGKLLDLYRRAGLHAKAERLLREDLEEAQRKAGPERHGTSGPLAWLGRNLLDQERYAEAEPLLRECLELREKLAAVPNPPVSQTLVALTKGALAQTLVGQRKFAVAEPLLLAQYAGLVGGPPATRSNLRNAIEQLIQLYEAWDKPEKAAEWRAKQLPELGPPPREVK